MRLVGAITQGSGAVNEDHWGVSGSDHDVQAAWVLDGVTGINPAPVLGGASDAQWLVLKAHQHLAGLAERDAPLATILAELVERLMADVSAATRTLRLADGFDPPAACLLLAKRYADGWRVLRLGDSSLVWRDEASRVQVVAPDISDDTALARAARQQRAAGVTDIKALLKQFAPELHAARQRRNRPGGYSVLEADRAALTMPQELHLGFPAEILLCTDGYYRAVDHYGLVDAEGLLAQSARAQGVNQMMARIREIEAGDLDCRTYIRFKPSDDVAAVVLA